METIEYRTMDKSVWGPGPWQNEPDKRQWQDEATGLPCLIVRNSMGALCGYVGVSEGHAKIDGQPRAIVGRPIAVEGEVHADLADAAKRHENELVEPARHCAQLPSRGGEASRNTSPAAIVSLAPPGKRSMRLPASSSASKRPVNSSRRSDEQQPHVRS